MASFSDSRRARQSDFSLEDTLLALLVHEAEVTAQEGGGEGTAFETSWVTLSDLSEADLFIRLVQRASGLVIVVESGVEVMVALSPRVFENLVFDRVRLVLDQLLAPQASCV